MEAMHALIASSLQRLDAFHSASHMCKQLMRALALITALAITANARICLQDSECADGSNGEAGLCMGAGPAVENECNGFMKWPCTRDVECGTFGHCPAAIMGADQQCTNNPARKCFALADQYSAECTATQYLCGAPKYGACIFNSPLRSPVVLESDQPIEMSPEAIAPLSAPYIHMDERRRQRLRRALRPTA